MRITTRKVSTRKYFPNEETIGIDSHKIIDDFKSESQKVDDNKTSRKQTDKKMHSRLSSSSSRLSTPITLTVYSDIEETAKVSYMKPELRDKTKNIEEKQDKVTYNIKIEHHSPFQENETSKNQPSYRTNNQKDAELSLTSAMINPETTPIEYLEPETSFKFTEKTYPIDRYGKIHISPRLNHCVFKRVCIL